MRAGRRGGRRPARLHDGRTGGHRTEVVLKAVAEPECSPPACRSSRRRAAAQHTARTLGLACGYEIVRRGEPLPAESAAPII